MKFVKNSLCSHVLSRQQALTPAAAADQASYGEVAHRMTEAGSYLSQLSFVSQDIEHVPYTARTEEKQRQGQSPLRARGEAAARTPTGT